MTWSVLLTLDGSAGGARGVTGACALLRLGDTLGTQRACGGDSSVRHAVSVPTREGRLSSDAAARVDACHSCRHGTQAPPCRPEPGGLPRPPAGPSALAPRAVTPQGSAAGHSQLRPLLCGSLRPPPRACHAIRCTASQTGPAPCARLRPRWSPSWGAPSPLQLCGVTRAAPVTPIRSLRPSYLALL